MKKEKTKNAITNTFGILAAFGIAAGGLLFVHNRLAREEELLLQSGGMVEIPVQYEVVEAVKIGEEEITVTLLSEADLYRVVEDLETKVEAYPHEPWEGQLSMAEAADCGVAWIESFLLPAIGIEGFKLQEYRINCHLWAWQEDIDKGEKNPLFSYWSVWFSSGELTAELVLNAVTGQVLDACVNSSMVVEYQNQDTLGRLLSDYTDSFGLEEAFTIRSFEEGVTGRLRLVFRSTGEEGLSASVEASTFAATHPDSYVEVVELFHIDLRLGTKIE